MVPSNSLGNRSFLAFVATQYLGAFNDNVFKQVVLLMAVLVFPDQDMQGPAMIVFSLPFLLFSGYAGQLSEMHPKTTIMRLSKIAELVIMVLGVVGFFLGNFYFLLAVLFIMGMQSTFFGPSKFGIIPELVEDRLLVKANGVVSMTTFLAIILGSALAGFLKTRFADELHYSGYVCIFIAVLGILAVYAIRAGVANRQDMTFTKHPFSRVFASLKKAVADRPLFIAIIAASFFWFSGGIAVQVVNNYGLILLELSPAGTSLLLVAMSFGIMLGCLAASPLQEWVGGPRTILIGAVGTAIAEFFLYFYQIPMSGIYGLLILTGICSGLYYVPIAAFMQARPPLGEKGEILAAVNFSNYIGIVLSGAVWWLLSSLVDAHFGWWFLSGSLALMIVFMLPQLKRIDQALAD